MTRNFAVGVILMLGGISFLFVGVMIPLLTQTTTDWQTEHEAVPIEATLMAFALLICGLILVAVELASGGVVYTDRRKMNHGDTELKALFKILSAGRSKIEKKRKEKASAFASSSSSAT